MRRLLITGGAGYIGSHTCVELLRHGYEVVIYDNLANAHQEVFERIEAITGKRPLFIKGDILDGTRLQSALKGCDAVIHFAGLKAVGESVHAPLRYYTINVAGTIVLLQAMQQARIRRLIYSSSATVYGNPIDLPLRETHPLQPTNPYGNTKLMCEKALHDLYRSDPSWSIAILRYFNPVGAHESGLIGEDPLGYPNNLMPLLSQVAIGRRPSLAIYGNDYPTPDGTGIRDYIHVVDLAKGHASALATLDRPGYETYNLGTGYGYSVLEVVQTFEKVSQRSIPYTIAPRREGDVAICYANVDRAAKILRWQAMYDLHKMCEDTWRWQSRNPNGYQNKESGHEKL